MLEGVIDYAGLFPPAKLPLGDAVSEYFQLIQSPEKWIVDRFACPATRLKELAIELAEHPDEPLVPVAVIGSSQPDHKHWRHGIEHDANEMTNFQLAADRHAEIQAYEVRLPDHTHIGDYIGDLESFTNVDVFAELPWAPDMGDSLTLLAEMDGVCAKARTGGLDATAFPSTADLAAFIQQCAQLDLTFKLTAGLHHPLPSRDIGTGANMHGFLNVLTATALALAEDLSKREIEDVLSESDPKAFSFKRDFFTWRGHKSKLEDIESARTLLVSFGSCSVREPLDDLTRLGWIEKVAQ